VHKYSLQHSIREVPLLRRKRRVKKRSIDERMQKRVYKEVYKEERRKLKERNRKERIIQAKKSGEKKRKE